MAPVPLTRIDHAVHRSRHFGLMPGRLKILFPVALLLTLTGCETTPPQPDVIVIVLDTVRPDHLGFCGAPSEPAPFLASVAERATVFTEALSTSSWTAPATASIVTGLYPLQHGVVEGMLAHRARERERGATDQAGSINRIAPDVPTLAERLHDLGYRTWALATNPNIGEEIGFFRGFDRSQRLEPVRLDVRGNPPPAGRGQLASAPADRVLARLRTWVDEDDDAGPRFVYLHLNDAHHPYHQRAPWFRPAADRIESHRSAYDSEIQFMDSVLEEIWELLEIESDDLVIIVSDHGEGFGDHGIVAHEWGLYRATNRVLLMVDGPGLASQHGKIDVPVSLIDVVPTIMDVQGVEVSGLPGSSLLPLLRSGAPDADSAFQDRTLFAHRLQQGTPTREAWAARSGSWKLILDRESPELYDVREDPGELVDLAADRPELTTRFVDALLEFQQWPRPDLSEAPLMMDEERLEMLRSLGYIE